MFVRKTLACFIALASAAGLAACTGGVTPIGSGDAPFGRSGSAAISDGGSKALGGDIGAGAVGTGASSALGGAGAAAGADTGGSDTGGAAPTGSCQNDWECPDAGPCEECADGSYACNKSFCRAGKCMRSGEMCRAQCMFDIDCPVLGLACNDCGDGTKSCPRTQCLAGKCQTSFLGCHNVDPCDGLACGAPCKQCSGGSCDAGLVPLYCGADGSCESGLPQCGADVKCRTAKDCVEAPLECVACGADSCAGFECIDGACTLACPANPDPECRTTLECPATDVCKRCPGSGACASRVCWKGNCELACEP
jgi:hypothetical protein